MFEYSIDLKGQVMCIQSISKHCKCFLCQERQREHTIKARLEWLKRVLSKAYGVIKKGVRI